MNMIRPVNLFQPKYPLLLTLLLVLLVGLPPSFAQSTIYVRVNGINSNPATAGSWTNALSGTALQTALTTAPSGTTFLLGAGVYTPTTSTDQTISFSVPSGVQLYGGYAGEGANPDDRTSFPSSTTLSGVISTSVNSYHVVRFTSASTATRLDGVIITGGKADGGGDQELFGGGVVIFTRAFGEVNTPTLTNIYFVGNSATFGGAMADYADIAGVASPIVTNVNFSNNSATFGGALYNASVRGGRSSPSLTNVSFTNNSAANNGGAIYNGPVNNGSSASKLTNVSFVGNSATNAGGAICNSNYASNDNTVLTNVSFSNNSASTGGALYNSSALSPYKSPTLTNCVFFGNGGSNTFNNTANAPIDVAYSLLESNIPTSSYIDGGNNLSTASSPFISPSDLQLQLVSPAINKGSNTAYTTANGPGKDLAGHERIQNMIIDMGPLSRQLGPT